MSALLLAATMAIAVPCDEAHAVERGTEAACSGVLLPLSEATHALRCLTIDLPACERDEAHCEGLQAVEARAYEARIDALTIRVDEADQALAAMAKCPECERAWWDSPGMGFGAGVMATVAIIVTVVLGTR